jgi:aryl-alcohol dehydrogenase-like predicted oxidoreductase
MLTTQLGRSGLRVSQICLGTMTFGNQADEAASFAIMDVADRAGISFIDTADVYPLGGPPEHAGRTEEIVGRWVAERRARARVVLATKCAGRVPAGPGSGPNDEGLSRRHIIAACEASLRRLGTDYIDLYQLHWPDPSTPIEETLRALDDLVRSGKVRYVGCSNYLAWQLADALWTSRLRGYEPFISAQPRYNLLFRMVEDEILPLCRAHGVGVMAYNPLAGGMLTGRYRSLGAPAADSRFGLERSGELYRRRYWNEEVIHVVRGLGDFVQARGKSLTHVALRWVLDQPGVSCAIVGASRPGQLEDSLAGLDVVLDEEERRACDEAWFSLPRERDPLIARR